MKRFLIRTVVLWVILGPIFYVFGLPILMDKLSAKAQSESYAQCAEQLRKPDMSGAIPADKADSYCHCVSDGLMFTKPDLFDAMQHKPPAAITALQTSLVEKCNREINTPGAIVPGNAVQPADPAATALPPGAIEIK